MALPITISNKGLAVTISENGFGVPVVIVSGELPTAQAPALEGGALTKDGADLVVTAPVVTAGSPTPSVNFTLTRGGTDVRGEVVNGRIVNASPGTYVATWTASNGVGSPATATDTEVVSATAPGQFGPNDWELETGSGASELRLNIVKLPATGGSAITALEYNIDGGEFVALSGLNVGARVLTMPQGATAYSVTVRAVNAVGAGTPSAAKVATSNVVPAITATIDLQPAGQQSSITFNVAIDGSPTIAQGATSITATRVGTTNQWTFTAPVEGPISFAATKAGYTAFSDATRTVAPAPSALIERDYEIMLQGDPGSEPLEIIEPQEYAAPYVTPDSSLTNGIAVFAEAVISRTGDAITATRDPLFTWDDSIEPISYGHAYYRGTTALNATIIEGTEGAAIYVIDPALDGGKNVYRRDWLEGAGSDGELAVFSNGIAVAAPANWWVPDSIVDVDFQNNRARINGVSYASIAAARTANAIKTSPTGVDYTDVSGLGTSYVLAAKGITADVNQTQILAALDDGDDGTTNDEIVYVGRHFATNEYRAALFAQAGNSSRLSSINSPLLPTSSPVRMAVRAKNGAYYGMVNGVEGATSNASGSLPAVTRVTYGKRSVASELAWTGTVHRVVVINADLTNDQINALLA